MKFRSGSVSPATPPQPSPTDGPSGVLIPGAPTDDDPLPTKPKLARPLLLVRWLDAAYEIRTDAPDDSPVIFWSVGFVTATSKHYLVLSSWTSDSQDDTEALNYIPWGMIHEIYVLPSPTEKWTARRLKQHLLTLKQSLPVPELPK